MNPTIIRSGPHLLAETYTIALNALGTFDTTDAGANNALFLLAQYSRLENTNVQDIAGVSFNGVAATFVQKVSSISNNNISPRMALYVITNPAKVSNGVVEIRFTANITDSNAQVAVYPILMRDVNQTTPVGYKSTSNIIAVQDTVLLDDHWDIPVPAQGGNSLIFGAYMGETLARNGFAARGDTVELGKGVIDFPANPDKTYWMGTRDVTYNGLIEFKFSQTVYPDTCLVFVFEALSSDVVARSVLPYSNSIGTNPVVTFSNLVGAPPTSMTLSCGGLSQTVAVVNNAGTYTVSMPTLDTNAVMLGDANLTFIDNSVEIKSVFTYNALPLHYRAITSAVNETAYSSWTTKPRIGDLLIYDNATTSVTSSGDLEAYDAGTYSYSIIRKLEGITETFSVTFNETFTFSIDNANSSSNISLNQLAHVALSNGNNINPAWVGIENVTTGVIYPQQEFSYSSNFNTLTYRVVIPNYNSGHTYILRTYAEDGTYDILPVTIVTAVPAVDNRTDYIPSLLSLTYDIAPADYTLRNGSTANVSTTALATATGATVAGRAVVGMTGSANLYSIPNPSLSAGATVLAYGESTLTITNGTTTENFTINVLPLATQSYVTLTSVDTGLGHVGNYLTCAIGDQIVFDTSTTLGVAVNGVNVSGAIQTDYSGTQTMWHIRATDGLVTELSVITPVSLGIVSVNSGVVYVNGSSNTVTTVGLPTANGATLGSYPISGLTGSNNSYSFTLPTIADGVISPLLGNRVFTITDGTSSPTLNINVLPSPTLDFITLSGNGGTSLGYVGNVIACVAGDQIVFDTSTTLGVGANSVNASGAIQTDYSGTQTMWHIRASDGLVTELTVITPLSISVVSVNSGVVYVNGSSNNVTTIGLPTANGATLGSYPISGLTGSNNSYSFTLPTIANGVISPLLGNRAFTITDGTSSPTLNINVLPSPTLDFITLSGNGGTSLGYVGNTITCVAGDQIIFSKPATLSITENGVRADGSIFTDYNGTQTMYHRRGSDGLITEFSVLTSVVSVDKTPTSAVITPVTNAVLSQSYTSAGITVSGMDAGIDVACTITGGTYEISSNGGSSWSAATSAAGTIRNGYMFRLTGTASNLNNTVRNVVFSVGEGTITNFTFVITTVAAPRTINLANKLVRNLVSPLYDTKVTTSKTETVPNFIPGNNTTLLHSSVTNNTTVWLLNVPNFTTATIKLKQNITKAKGNIQVQINNTTGLSVGNNKLYLCKLNSSNAILTFKRVNINIT